MEYAIKANEVSLEYSDKTVALKSLNMEVNYGEIVFLTGESGSGKTSALRLIMGSEKGGGELMVAGENMYSLNKRQIRKLRQKIGCVFQHLRLIEHQSVMDNVMLPLRFIGRQKKRRQRALEAIEKVGLAGLEKKKVHLLSGGQKQRVAIARAIVSGAKILIADEPTGNLDYDNSLEVIRLYESLAREGAAVLITTHALPLMEQVEAYRHYSLTSGVSSKVFHQPPIELEQLPSSDREDIVKEDSQGNKENSVEENGVEEQVAKGDEPIVYETILQPEIIDSNENVANKEEENA